MIALDWIDRGGENLMDEAAGENPLCVALSVWCSFHVRFFFGAI